MNIAKCVTLLACLFAVVAVSVPPSATADTSRTAVFRSGGQTLRIHATGRSGPFSTRIQLFVNGEVVAEGATTQFRPVVNLSGEYQGKQIDAECQNVATGAVLHRECTVYVDSQQAATLVFR